MAEQGRGPVRRLAGARLVSNAGTSAAVVAVAYEVYQQTHSAYWLSALFLLTFGVNGLLSPFFGTLADRFDRRRIMVASDLIGALFFAMLIFARAPATMIGLAFAASLAATPFWSASGASIPNLAPEGDLRWANSVLSTAGWVGRLAGFGVGGVLLAAAGSGAVFGVNSISFGFSALLVVSIRRSFGKAQHEQETKPKTREGFAFILADRTLWVVVAAGALMFFAVDLVEVADVPLARSFHTGSVGYGLLQAMYAGGSVIGAFCGRWVREHWERRILILDTIFITVAYLVVAVSPWFAIVLVAILVSAIADTLAGVTGLSLVQQRTPDALRGRVLGAMESAFLGANTIAFLVAGPLTSAIGPRGTYVSSAVAAATAFTVLTIGFRVRPQLATTSEPRELPPEG
jgi:MFS family permease